MADVIILKYKSFHLLFEPEDFEYLVKKYMGYDAEKYFRETIEKLQDEADYTKAKVYTDLESYEASLESNTACFQDILDITEQMKTILEAPRMNKNKMFELIEQVQKEINNQI